MLLVLYLPVAFGGYALYGKTVHPNILLNVTHGKLVTLIDILMAFHVLCAFLIVINPVTLTFEQSMKIPHSKALNIANTLITLTMISEFTWKRIAVRSVIGLLIMFTGLSVPKFGKILNLVGGSTIALTTFILPPIFYISLIGQRHPDWPLRTISRWTKVGLIAIAVIGLVGGITCTYSALVDLFDPAAFTRPCYSRSTPCNATAAAL